MSSSSVAVTTDTDVIVSGNHDHGRILAKASGTLYNPDGHVVISREEGGKLLGGVIYQAYNKASIVIHVAGLSPAG